MGSPGSLVEAAYAVEADYVRSIVGANVAGMPAAVLDECCQEAWAKCWERRDRIEGSTAMVRGWVALTATRLAWEQAGRMRRLVYDVVVETLAEDVILEHELDGIAPEHRALLMLRFAGFTRPEMERMLGWSKPLLNKRLGRAYRAVAAVA